MFKYLLTIGSIIGLTAVFFMSQSSPIVEGRSPTNGEERHPSCVDDYDTWYSSTTYNPNAQWDITFMPNSYDLSQNPRNHQFVDVNGDGLQDYVVSHLDGRHPQNTSQYPPKAYCVALNTGIGWEVAFRCVIKYSGVNVTYYGDCAL
jgi:hypothetical protein